MGDGRPGSLQEVDGGCLSDEPLSQGRVGLQGITLHQKAPAETETGSMVEPPRRMWGLHGSLVPRQNAGSWGWGEQDVHLPRLLERGQDGQRPRGRMPGLGGGPKSRWCAGQGQV